MDDQYILGIDLGTTTCKIAIVDHECHIVAREASEYAANFPRPGWAEQVPEIWWQAVCENIRKIRTAVNLHGIRAIGLTGQMHGLVLLNRKGKALRPAILWNDQRAAPQCDQIYQLVGGEEGLLQHTNNPMLPGYTGGKILWVREHEPELFKEIDILVLPKDYIRYRLTAELVTDVSDASGTGLYNVCQRSWATELMGLLDLPTEWFPKAFESVEIVGKVIPQTAEEIGLPAGIPVVAGGGDAVMQMVGSGAIDSTVALIVIGTGGNVSVSLPNCIYNPGARLQVFCHVIPDHWASMGVTLSAGSSLKWFRDALGNLEVSIARELRIDPYELLNLEAEKSPPGAKKVIFLPYLQGERAPYADPNARGAFIGLSSNHTRYDLVRAVMEGVTYSLRDVFEIILNVGINPLKIHASGGGSSSSVWRQVLADVFERDVTTLDYSADAGVLGAAIIAGYGVGFWSTVEEAVGKIKTNTLDKPIDENLAIYRDLFPAYQSLYASLKPIYDLLASIAGD